MESGGVLFGNRSDDKLLLTALYSHHFRLQNDWHELLTCHGCSLGDGFFCCLAFYFQCRSDSGELAFWKLVQYGPYEILQVIRSSKITPLFSETQNSFRQRATDFSQRMQFGGKRKVWFTDTSSPIMLMERGTEGRS